MNDLDTLIPRRLDMPARILVWDPSQVGLLVAFVFLGIALHNPIMWIGFGLFINFIYGRVISNKPRGFVSSWFYWILPFRAGYTRIPPSSFREFIG
jgi:TraL protein.